MTGNTAVLQCVVPSYLREFVSVTSWQLEDARHVYPSLHGGEYWRGRGGPGGEGRREGNAEGKEDEEEDEDDLENQEK